MRLLDIIPSRWATCITIVIAGTFAYSPVSADLDKLTLPAGFTIERLPFEVPDARQMALSGQGTLVIGSRRKGVVYAVPNALTDSAPVPITILEDLTMPSGLAIRNGDLYVGATHEILKLQALDSHLSNPQIRTVTNKLPTERHHGWKYLKFGPDGFLYVPVGAPCNICLREDDPRFASLLRMNPKTGAAEVWAHGIRNTVGFAWHPATQQIWFSDNGRDMMGDDVPPEEINIITEPGQHFGYPFVHAGDIDDPQFGDHPSRAGKNFVDPAVKIQAHSAALGMAFNTHDAFPETYNNALFVAEHGSWNRSAKVGYLVSVVTEAADGSLNYAPFITGWLQGEENWGRPNDILFTPDGDMLISDDQGGVIFRVRYTGSGDAPKPPALQIGAANQ